jgi:hypothetical protein
VPVVEGLVFGQDAEQVSEVPHKSPVQKSGSDGSVPALLDRVHAWGLDGRGDDLDVGGPGHGIERRDELWPAIPHEELEPICVVFEVHQGVAGHLDGPLSGGVAGGAEDPDPPGGMLDHREDVGGGAVEQVDGEEAGGEDRFGLRAQELRPGWP